MGLLKKLKNWITLEDEPILKPKRKQQSITNTKSAANDLALMRNGSYSTARVDEKSDQAWEDKFYK